MNTLVDTRWHSFSTLDMDTTGLSAAIQEHFPDIAHDVYTPLSRLKLTAKLLQKTLGTDAMDRHLGKLDREIDDLENLVSKMFALLRIECDVTNPRIFVGKIDDLLENLINSFEKLADERHVSLQYRAKSDLPKALFDFDKIRQALYEIIENAIQHTHTGGIIHLEARTEGKHLALSVRDNGTGIPAEALPFIFQRFYRVDEHRDLTKGRLGLGLALAHQLVRLNNGHIQVKSAVGLGSEFTIFLPYLGR